MSTLTKILIVLLTISSIFLCGIVVTYVANADNYRQKYNNLRADRDASKANENSFKRQLNENIAKSQQLEDKLNNEIASLKVEIGELQVGLKNAEREKADLLQRVSSLASVVETSSQTAGQQGQLLKNTLEELKKIKAEQIKERKELDETTADLLKKMAIITTLDAEKKRLLEEKSELQSRLDRFLLRFGKEAAVPVPVTPEKDIARLVRPVAKDINLKGLVTKVDLKNSLAEISIGAADHVREGMTFYVVRGDEFICEILIIDVDTEKAVGVLERVQYQPKVGDNISTNL